jgi:hypothetical protein
MGWFLSEKVNVENVFFFYNKDQLFFLIPNRDSI